MLHKHIFFALITLLLTFSIGFSQDSTLVDSVDFISFEEELALNNMQFEAPEGYLEIEPITNRQMNYSKAFKHPKEKFEVRYAIRNHDFGFYQQLFEVTVLNISGGKLPGYSGFNPDVAKREFGADVGITVMVEVGKEFGQDYEYCLLVYIHKKGIGDGYIFYLADDPGTLTELMMPIFHALKFKKE